LTLSVRQRGLQQGMAYGNARCQGGVAGDVADRNGFAVDLKGGAGAKGRRVVRALWRRGHDARECGSYEAWSRSGVVVLRQATASRCDARRAGPAERADGLARPANVCREAVFGATVGGGGRARDAVGDDKLEPGDHGVFVEDDLKAKCSKRERRRWRSKFREKNGAVEAERGNYHEKRCVKPLSEGRRQEAYSYKKSKQKIHTLMLET